MSIRSCHICGTPVFNDNGDITFRCFCKRDATPSEAQREPAGNVLLKTAELLANSIIQGFGEPQFRTELIECLRGIATHLYEVTVERDALQQVIDRLTSDEAVEAIVTEWRKYIKNQPTFRLKLWARAAITAALAVASRPLNTTPVEYGETPNLIDNEGGEG